MQRRACVHGSREFGDQGSDGIDEFSKAGGSTGHVASAALMAPRSQADDGIGFEQPDKARHCGE
jgi:hypothetical protein